MEGRHYKDMSRAVENGVAAFLDTPPRTAWLSGPLTTYNEALA